MARRCDRSAPLPARCRNTSPRSRADTRRPRGARSSSREATARARAPCARSGSTTSRLLRPTHSGDLLDVGDAGNEPGGACSARKRNVELEPPAVAVLAHLDRLDARARALDRVDHRTAALAARNLYEQPSVLGAVTPDDSLSD